MICPNCAYEYQSKWESDDKQEHGELGDFFFYNKSIKRHHGNVTERLSVAGCPKCKMMFMED